MTDKTFSQFDFDYNGAMDKATVLELATADFVARGESVLLAGGGATGKTTLAAVIIRNAQERGFSVCRLMSGPNYMFAGEELMDRMNWQSRTIVGEPRFRSDLLECDVLVVEEAEKWLTCIGNEFICLLGRRLELGRSNVLLVTRRANASPLPDRNPVSTVAALVALQLVGDPQSVWGQIQAYEPIDSFTTLFKAFGVDTSAQVFSDCTGLPAGGATLGRALEPAPTWHLVYTGQNSYRRLVA